MADGILVRGDIGSTLSAKVETFKPLTHLEFPKYEPSFSGNGTPNQTAFKLIRSQSPDTDSNQGLVFLDINRGGLFRHQITIRDNWVFKTMRVGIHAAGQGLVIRNNDVHDQAEKTTWVDPTGKRQPRGAMTFENRAIDWSGHGVRIEGNTYDVYRHRIMESQYFSTDGEGILTQQCCGGTSVERVTIHNNRGRGYIGIYKVPDINQLTISGNQVRSPSSNFPTIYVNADTNNAPGSMSGVTIIANQLEGGMLAQASGGGNNNYVNNNRGTGVLKRSCHVQIEQNTGFEIQPCQGE